MMLKSIFASALLGLPSASPAWGQAQPDPLPKGVIQKLTIERPNWTTNTSFDTMEFSPDGRLLAAAGNDAQIHLWDLPSGRESLQPLQGREPIKRLAFLQGGKTLVSLGLDHVLRLWELPAGKEALVLKGPYHDFACSPDERILAALESGRISLMDMDTKRGTAWIRVPNEGIHALAFSPDGKSLGAGCDDGGVRIWDVSRQKEILRFKAVEDKFITLIWSPDGRRIATATYRNDAYRVWDASTGKEVFRMNEGGTCPPNITFSRDGKMLASTCGGSGALIVWEAETGKELFRWNWPQGKGTRRLAFSPDSQTMATGIQNGSVYIWDLSTVRKALER